MTFIKQVYNARTRWRKGQREDKTKLKYLISKLEKHQYVYFTRANSEETTLEDLFFVHPESIDMLNTFPTVLVMDSTYKTNTYRMPLFEIVGVTSTKMMYSVAFAFLSFEQENNFIWELERLVGLLTSKHNMPMVTVTFRDPDLMKVVAEVLPKINHVLCYCHFEKNVKSRCITDSRVNAKPLKEKVVGKDAKEADDDKHYGGMEHRYKRQKLFAELEGYLSRAALGFIDEEFQRSRTFGFAKEDCGCVQMTTFGFPCACILAEKRKKNCLFFWMKYTLIGEG